MPEQKSPPNLLSLDQFDLKCQAELNEIKDLEKLLKSREETPDANKSRTQGSKSSD